MIEQHAPPGVADDSAGSPGSAGTSFNRWLEVQLKARRLTQRQLAHKSGVDHSTISRLMRGERTPSLRTAALLARGLGVTGGLDWLEPRSHDETALSTARVEHALRLDQILSDAQVREVMLVYLTARLGRRRSMPVRPPARTMAAVSVTDEPGLGGPCSSSLKRRHRSRSKDLPRACNAAARPRRPPAMWPIAPWSRRVQNGRGQSAVRHAGGDTRRRHDHRSSRPEGRHPGPGGDARTGKRTHHPFRETVQTERRSVTRTGPAGTEMLRRIIVLVFGLIQIVIGLRIVLLLLDARTGNALVSGVLDVSRIFVAPFEGILNSNALSSGGATLDVAAVVALVGWTILELIVLWVVGIFRREPA